MRRKDRQVTDLGEIAGILTRCDVMRIAVIDGDSPYIVPLNFAFDIEGDPLPVFYFHTAAEGRMLRAISVNPRVAFEVGRMIGLKKDERPCKWSAYHESVMGSGYVEVVPDETERKKGMDRIMKRYGFEGVPDYDPAVLARTVILRIIPDELAAKQNLPKDPD